MRREHPRGGYQLLNMEQVVRMDVREAREPHDTTVTASFAGDVSATFTGEAALRLLESIREHSGEPFAL